MKFCPQCGTTFEPDARFCQECGFDKHNIETQDEVAGGLPVESVLAPEAGIAGQSQPLCPKCQAPLPGEDRFCAECGFDRQSTESVIMPPVAETSDITPTTLRDETVNVQNVCPACASAMAEEDRFCLNCGFDIKATQHKETTVEVHPVMPLSPAEPEVFETPSVFNEEVKAAQPGLFCPSCGVAMQSGDVFCQECGFRMTLTDPNADTVLGSATPPPAPPSPPLPPPPAPSPQVTPAVVPPVVPPVVPVSPTAPAFEKSKPVASSASGRKGKKIWVIALLGLLAVGVLGAGGWFAYHKFFAGKDNTKTETVVSEVQTPLPEVTEAVAEPEVVVEEKPAVEVTKENPETVKKTTPPKTKPKKQAETKVTEPPKEEPAKKNEGVSVVMNTKTTAKSPITLYNIFNTNEVKSGPVFPTKIKFNSPTVVTRIITFHYNNGNGAPAGTIMLEGKKKETGGPWQARNAPDSEGNPNGKWIVEPNARMEPGTYKIVVSDEKSWSFNAQSGRRGMVIVEGYEAD